MNREKKKVRFNFIDAIIILIILAIVAAAAKNTTINHMTFLRSRFFSGV